MCKKQFRILLGSFKEMFPCKFTEKESMESILHEGDNIRDIIKTKRVLSDTRDDYELLNSYRL